MLICILYQVLWSGASTGIKSFAPQIPRPWLKLQAELSRCALCAEGSLAGETCVHCSKSAKSAKEPLHAVQTAAHLVWQLQGDLTHTLKTIGSQTEHSTKVSWTAAADGISGIISTHTLPCTYCHVRLQWLVSSRAEASGSKDDPTAPEGQRTDVFSWRISEHRQKVCISNYGGLALVKEVCPDLAAGRSETRSCCLISSVPPLLIPSVWLYSGPVCTAPGFTNLHCSSACVHILNPKSLNQSHEFLNSKKNRDKRRSA